MVERVCGGKGAYLHSRDIRNKVGIFRVFQNKEVYSQFKSDMNDLLGQISPQFISCSVDKRVLSEKMAAYRNETGEEYAVGDIYLDCFEYVLERIARFLGDKKGMIVFDMITNRKKIQRVLLKCKKEGGTRHPARYFKNINDTILFCEKEEGVCGLQVVDYCGYPFFCHARDGDDSKNRFF